MTHGRNQRLERDPRNLAGKDELNLSDWRIGVATHQQPRTKEGGKIDFVEYTIPNSQGPDQKITLEAPSRKGLPTPADEDVLLGLLALAKEQEFESDILHFVPRRLLQVLRWPLKQSSWDRVELALKRLRAVTITYELAWYNKLTAEVEPILVTGILAEAKLVRRRGRLAKDAVPDSYIQWTNDFYQSIKGGNLTDLDLDLYFSLKRPGSKQLYRHLNKRFHGKRRNQAYDRDLSHLACGHLGMSQSKDLKRNFHSLVTELETIGYLPKRAANHRYSKVRPGVYRVHFDPPVVAPKAKRRTRSDESRDDRGLDAATRLVSEFHKQLSGLSSCKPTNAELKHARSLLVDHDEALLIRMLPRVLAEMQRARFADKAKYFGSAVRYFENVIEDHRKQVAHSEREQQRRVEQAKQDADHQAQISRDRQRLDGIRTEFLALPEEDRTRVFQEAISATATEFQRNFIRRKGCDVSVASDVLEYFARLSAQ